MLTLLMIIEEKLGIIYQMTEDQTLLSGNSKHNKHTQEHEPCCL